MKTRDACKDCDGEWDVDSYTVIYCPLHQAAPELLAALKAVVAGENTEGMTIRQLRSLIAKAEGRTDATCGCPNIDKGWSHSGGCDPSMRNVKRT